MRIITYNKEYKDAVYNFIYSVMLTDVGKTRQQLDIELTDLNDITESYQESGGQFWICLGELNEVIGTLGLMKKDIVSGEVRRFYVDKGRRNQGIGTLLFDRLEKFAINSQYSKLNLSVGKSLTEAQKFYSNRMFLFVKETRLGNCRYSKELLIPL